MNILQIGIGVVVGFAISSILSKKRKNTIAYEASITPHPDALEKLRKEYEEISDELDNVELLLKKTRDERDDFDIKASDSEIELKTLKDKNSYLMKETEDLKSKIEEYEMLYNAKKDEISELRKKLNN